jgi:hypothetical protein
MNDRMPLQAPAEAAYAAPTNKPMWDLYRPIPGLNPLCGAVFNARDFRPIRNCPESGYVAPDPEPSGTFEK